MYKDLTLAFSKQQCIKGVHFLKHKSDMILFEFSAGYDVFRHPSHPCFDVFIWSDAFKMNSFLTELRQKLPTLQAFPGTVRSVPVEDHQAYLQAKGELKKAFTVTPRRQGVGQQVWF